MDKKILRALLEEVAIVKDIGIDIGPNGRTLLPKQETKKIKEVYSLDEFEEEEEEIEIPIHNPTINYVIDGLKPNYKICELGCGAQVSNQIIQKRKYQQPEPHWRTICRNCQQGLSPCKTQLIKNGAQLNQAYFHWFNNKQDK